MKPYPLFNYFRLRSLYKVQTLSLNLTWRCNLKCPYCAVAIPTGKIPDSIEKTVEETKDIIKSFPYKINEIQLSGGSPEMWNGFVDLANWILDEGYFLHINTNLTFPHILNKIRTSRKLLFIVTYHHSLNPNIFESNYNYLSSKYQIKVDEIDDREMSSEWNSTLEYYNTENKLPYFPFSRLKKLVTPEEMKNRKTMLRISPDHKLAISCYDACK